MLLLVLAQCVNPESYTDTFFKKPNHRTYPILSEMLDTIDMLSERLYSL